MGLVSTLPLILPLTLPSHHCFLFLFFSSPSFLRCFFSGSTGWNFGKRAVLRQCAAHWFRTHSNWVFRVWYWGAPGTISCRSRYLVSSSLQLHPPSTSTPSRSHRNYPSTSDCRRALWPCTEPRFRSPTPRFSHRSVCLDAVEAHCTSGAV